jgi:phosphotransacetylase
MDGTSHAPAMIENRVFSETAVGDSASLAKRVTQQDIELFAVVSSDVNPAHRDPAYAATGQADTLVAPDLEAGNMLAKQLTFLAGADAAGVVPGARVPIILTSPAAGERTRLASCAVAVLLARGRMGAMAAA